MTDKPLSTRATVGIVSLLMLVAGVGAWFWVYSDDSPQPHKAPNLLADAALVELKLVYLPPKPVNPLATPPPRVPPTPFPRRGFGPESWERNYQRNVAPAAFAPEPVAPGSTPEEAFRKAGIPTQASPGKPFVRIYARSYVDPMSRWIWNPSKKRYEFSAAVRCAVDISRTQKPHFFSTKLETINHPATSDQITLSLPRELSIVRDSLPPDMRDAEFDAYRFVKEHPDILEDMIRRRVISYVIDQWNRVNRPTPSPPPTPSVIGSKLKSRRS